MSTALGRSILLVLFAVSGILWFIPSVAVGAADFTDVGSILGFKGETQEGSTVFKFPRTDIKVTVEGEPVPTALGFGGWTAWTPMGNGVMVMGDLVLLQEEVNQVISALAEANINVNAIHNHFLGENPRIMYMHIEGTGNPTILARGLANALGKTALPKPQAQKPAAPEVQLSLDTARLESIIGQKGQAGGGFSRLPWAVPV